jgi:chromosome partitioning protein
MAKRDCMPFTIADECEGLYAVRHYQHVIVDTEARPGAADFEDLARDCDLLVIPTMPTPMDTDILILILAAAQKLVPDKYRVLLTKVSPAPEPEGAAKPGFQCRGSPSEGIRARRCHRRSGQQSH